MSNGAIYYNPNLKSFSKINRNQKNMTKYEGILWNIILKQNKTGYRFLRQKIIDNYILDFYCGKLKLAIEIDGDSHNYSIDYDKKRNNNLKKLGIKTIRYTNTELNRNLEGVLADIQDQIKNRRKELNL
ncbi:endonuclease domain-containing protein [Candidatus Gracilibacteria bacterium]|nr:endonuclease domain-containing protein [Candidatus Gracilibacteria bacterium]